MSSPHPHPRTSSSPNAAVFGCTGLVGGQILAALLKQENPSIIHTISRRAPKAQPSAQAEVELDAIVESDTQNWVSCLEALKPFPSTVFSGIGTTRAAAGSIANQWKIDHDLNIEIARAAKAKGARTFVFISSAGSQSLSTRLLPYTRMKKGVEDAIRELDFEQAIIVRPGIIMGDRDVEHQGAPPLKAAIRFLGRFSQSLADGWGQHEETIGRAAVHAAKLAEQGKAPSKFWTVEIKDIVRLGRDEWKE